MNYFLLLIVLALGGAGYYEYTVLQDTDSANKEKFADLSSKIDALQAENKKIEDTQKQLADSVAKESPSAPAPVPPSSVAPSVAAPVPVIPAGPIPSNDLGVIITPQKTLQDCHLLHVKASAIVVKYADGITEVKYADLSGELQKRFGYNPQLNNDLTPEQVQAAELQRQAARN